jgi:hypothetical protein
MKIAFHDNSLSLRGTTVAIYNWALYTQQYLDIDPIILYNKKHPANNQFVQKRFAQKFEVFNYSNKKHIDKILQKQQVDVFFMEKGGKPDGVISTTCKNWVNAIAVCTTSDIHGDKFAMGSKWLSKITDYKIPYVPYIVDLPNINGTLREEFAIPKDALVIGRNGGWDTFDLDFAQQAVIDSLSKRPNLWYLFQFTKPFVTHERVIWLPGSPNVQYKVKFIQTCDAMLHARYIGESFGLSCAEFSIKNKPIITWNGSPERNHIETLGEKGLYYSDYNSLLEILLNFDKQDFNNSDWNCYQEYGPQEGCEKFRKVYMS